MTIYKIRDKNTGLYSTGGMYPRWEKDGKVWKRIGHLKCHLRIFTSISYNYNVSPPQKKIISGIPENWEVVEFKLTISEEFTKTWSAKSLYDN